MYISNFADSARPESALTDRLIRLTTALAVVAVACVAAIISYQHAYELVSTHGERGLTARLLPFTVDGLIYAVSMLSGVVLDASRRGLRVPPPDFPALERAVRHRHDAADSQRTIARDLNVDRRKVKRIIEEVAAPLDG